MGITIRSDFEKLKKSLPDATLNPDKWQQFLKLWAQGLESYGTDPDFAADTTYSIVEIKFKERNFPFILVSAPNYARRKEMVSAQKHYRPILPAGQYRLRTEIDSCFLCQDIAQAEDSRLFPDKVKSNVLYDFQDFYILPNKYPSYQGHSLLVPKNHDAAKSTDTLTTSDMSETEKTLGNPITDKALEALIESCERFHFAGLRNHVLDGMSVTDHDHFHLLPEDLPMFLAIEEIRKHKIKVREGIYTLSDSPFDTLVLSTKTQSQLYSKAIPILQKMEQDAQVFTLAYYKGSLFISPRYNLDPSQKVDIGCGVAMHYLHETTPVIIEKIQRFMPLKSQFHWESYL